MKYCSKAAKILKLLSMILILTLLLSFNCTANASSTKKRFRSAEEITRYLQRLNNTQTQVMTEIQILDSLVKNKKVSRSALNKELSELSNESSSELANSGYSKRQINAIQSYDGKSDALSYVKSKRITNATLTCQYGLAGISNNKRHILIAYSFVWSSCPLFCDTDGIGIGWVTCDRNSYFISSDFESTPYLSISYYNKSNDSQDVYTA